jgi:hypothetical protein
MLWNVENLFLLGDRALTTADTQLDEAHWQKLSSSVRPNKNLQKCHRLGQIIRENNPDLVLLCEVGGSESLAQFNELFLNSAYSPALIEGNSQRNIDVGFLVKKNLPFYIDLNTNKNRPLNFQYEHEKKDLAAAVTDKDSLRFSRDVSELHLFSHNRDKRFLTLLLTHLKSQLDRDRIDPMGFQRRRAELNCMIDIYNEIHGQQPQPILVAGDFNGVAAPPTPDPEFAKLHEKSDLIEVMSWSKKAKVDFATYYQVGRGPQPEGRQIDYFFASPNLIPFVNPEASKVYRFKDHLGLELDPPTTMEAKDLLPSDHYPVIIELKDLPVD